MTFVLRQGDTEVEIEPLGNDQFVSEVYGYDGGTASLPDQLTATDTATLFLWQDLSGLSLVLVQDDPDGETGGSSTFEFTLPTDDDGTVLGEWVVEDDPSMFDSPTDDVVEWTWEAGETAGGAFRGLTGIPFGSDLVIDIDSRGRFVPLSNPWHHKQRYDRPIEGLEPPVWVCVFADNADNFDRLPPDGQPKAAYTIDDGSVVPQTDGTEPTNDMYVAISPGREETTLKFLADRAGFDNRLLFRDRVLVPNSTTEPPGTTFTLPGVGSEGFSFGLAAVGVSGLDSFRVLSGSIEDPDQFELSLDDPVTVTPPSAPADQRDATATVLSYVPGLDENDAAPGADADQDFYSAFPNRGGGLFPREFPIDGGFVGDQQQGPPETVGDAIDGKTVQGLDEPHDAFRVKNTLAIEFETPPRGRTLDSDVTGAIRVNSQFSEDDVIFRRGFDLEFDVRLFDPEDPEEPSKTIVEEGRLDDVEGFLKNFDRRVRPARTNTRYVGVDRVELRKDGAPIEGVRAATVWGGSNPYSHDLQAGIVEEGADFVLPLQNNPVIYSWVELTVLADGTKLVRVPDATPFPKHAGYLATGVDRTAGTLRADSKLDVIFDTDVTDSGDGYDVAVNEEDNNVWNTFVDTYGESFLPEDRPVSPYMVQGLFYLDSYREEYDSIRGEGQNGFVERPIMAFGRTPDGSELDRDETLALLDTAEGDWFPLSPFDVPSAAVMEPSEPPSVPGFGAATAVASLGLGGALLKRLSEGGGSTGD